MFQVVSLFIDDHPQFSKFYFMSILYLYRRYIIVVWLYFIIENTSGFILKYFKCVQPLTLYISLYQERLFIHPFIFILPLQSLSCFIPSINILPPFSADGFGELGVNIE